MFANVFPVVGVHFMYFTKQKEDYISKNAFICWVEFTISFQKRRIYNCDFYYFVKIEIFKTNLEKGLLLHYCDSINLI